MDYPQREQFFAHKFVRRLFKTCVAQEIGSDALALLIAIAHTEDAKRYTAPVTYYNNQLQSILGFLKWDRLNKARTVCIDAGLLHYEGRGERVRKPGIYWVIMPDGYDSIDDSPMDEGYVPHGYQEGYKAGYLDGYNACAKKNGCDCLYLVEGTNMGTNEGQTEVQTRVQTRGKHGDISSFPFPYPNPEECVAPCKATEQTPSTDCGRVVSTDANSIEKRTVSAQEPSEYEFPLKGGTPWSLSGAKLAEYREAYPDLDVDAELRGARQWLRDNPTKRKTSNGMLRCLTSWLNRSQNNPHKRANGGSAGNPIHKDPRSIALDLD